VEPPNDPSDREETLTGGFISAVTKVGDTVRRPTGPWTPAVHALLRHLEALGFDGAPRVFGIDGQGREVLSYVTGEAPERAAPDVVTERVLREVSGLLRRYHQTVSGFEPPSGVGWYYESLPGKRTVVCHNDLSPRNTVFREGRPVAFLDWDLAAPAPSVWDLAQAAWQFLPLSDDRGCARHGWVKPPDRARRLRIFCDGYGLPREDRVGFSGVVAERMAATASRVSSASPPRALRPTSAWFGRPGRISCGPRGHGWSVTLTPWTRPSSRGCSRVPALPRRPHQNRGGACSGEVGGLAHEQVPGQWWLGAPEPLQPGTDRGNNFRPRRIAHRPRTSRVRSLICWLTPGEVCIQVQTSHRATA
jgi:hypothetical protein